MFLWISAAVAARTHPLEANLRPPGLGIKEEAEGKRTWWPTGGPGSGLTGLHRQFSQSPTGGKVPVPDRAGQGGKCQFRTGRAGGKVPVPDLSEIRRRWQLRGGARWRQRGFAFLARPAPPPLAGVRHYQRQAGLF